MQILQMPQRVQTRKFFSYIRSWNYEIHSRDFDSCHMGTTLYLFCLYHRLSDAQADMIRCVMQELLLHLLMPACKAEQDPNIHLTLRCDTDIYLQIEYTGLKTDPLQILEQEETENPSIILLSQYIINMDLDGEGHKAAFFLQAQKKGSTL